MPPPSDGAEVDGAGSVVVLGVGGVLADVECGDDEGLVHDGSDGGVVEEVREHVAGAAPGGAEDEQDVFVLGGGGGAGLGEDVVGGGLGLEGGGEEERGGDEGGAEEGAGAHGAVKVSGQEVWASSLCVGLLVSGFGYADYAIGYRHVENFLPDLRLGGACPFSCFDWLWPGEGGSPATNDKAAPAANDKAPSFPTNEQLRHYKGMSDPQLSPDGKQVLVRIADATADGAKGHIWLVDVDGGAARQLTYSPAGDKRGEQRAQWMPDGKSVLFLAHRGEHTQLYRLPMDGGEAKVFDLKVAPQVDESKREGALPPAPAKKDDAKKDEEKVEPVAIDVASYRVSPDGKTIAIFAHDPETPGEKKAKDAKADAEWVDHGLHGSRMYLLDVATEKLTLTGAPMDVRGASWSADSSKLVAIAEAPNGVEELGPANSAWIVKAE